MEKSSSLLKQFREKWCNDLPSEFLDPMCHLDDIRKLLEEVIGDEDKNTHSPYWNLNELTHRNRLRDEQKKRAGL